MVNDIVREVEKIAEEIGIDRKRSIGEVAAELKVKTHVIRFWEENFPQIKPEVGSGGRRYYYNKQLKTLRRIKRFLYEEGYTIAGLKKLLGRKNKEEFQEEKKQDLDFLLSETPAEWQKRQVIEIDDFISEEMKVEEAEVRVGAGSKINPGARLLDFANLEVPLVDLAVKRGIEDRMVSIRANIAKLKNLWVI
jgi:DNA-binding transcriptional MerR regulator